MKKSFWSVFLVFICLTVLLSGCAPASTPAAPTLTSLPSTATPIPPTDAPIPSTNTPIPTATPTALPLFIPGANNSVHAIVVQPDGRILLGGAFTTLNGEPRNFLARLNPDRTLDTSFNPVADDNKIGELALQQDGEILVTGGFKTLGGEPRKFMARLNPDGTLDAAFNPGTAFIQVGEGGNGVSGLVIQPDGRILVWGYFFALDGQTNKNSFTRFNSDGTFDASLNLELKNPIVVGLALQPDGKIVVGGSFTLPGANDAVNIARLNPDGTLDAKFESEISLSNGEIAGLSVLAMQADGKILVGGDKEGAKGGIVVRLNPDGTVDDSFNSEIEGFVRQLLVQSDGRILVGGDTFTTSAGETQIGIVRLNPDGTLDHAFNPGIDGDVWVSALTMLPDGKIILGGNFTSVGGEERNSIAVLNSDGTLEDALPLNP